MRPARLLALGKGPGPSCETAEGGLDAFMPDRSEEDIARFLDLKTVAVAGASRDRSKYGNIVYRRLRDIGIKVYAVNPLAERIEGDPCYPSLARLPDKVQGVVIVVPPAETEKVVRAAAAAGVRWVWMQPGAESRDAVRFGEEHGLRVVWNACILVESRRAQMREEDRHG